MSEAPTVVLKPWAAFLTLYIREMKRFMKVVFQTIFTPLINSTLYLLIFGVSLGSNIKLESGDAQTMLKLYEALDDNDDVQKVYANFDIDESEME